MPVDDRPGGTPGGVVNRRLRTRWLRRLTSKKPAAGWYFGHRGRWRSIRRSAARWRRTCFTPTIERTITVVTFLVAAALVGWIGRGIVLGAFDRFGGNVDVTSVLRGLTSAAVVYAVVVWVYSPRWRCRKVTRPRSRSNVSTGRVERAAQTCRALRRTHRVIVSGGVAVALGTIIFGGSGGSAALSAAVIVVWLASIFTVLVERVSFRLRTRTIAVPIREDVAGAILMLLLLASPFLWLVAKGTLGDADFGDDAARPVFWLSDAIAAVANGVQVPTDPIGVVAVGAAAWGLAALADVGAFEWRRRWLAAGRTRTTHPINTAARSHAVRPAQRRRLRRAMGSSHQTLAERWLIPAPLRRGWHVVGLVIATWLFTMPIWFLVHMRHLYVGLVTTSEIDPDIGRYVAVCLGLLVATGDLGASALDSCRRPFNAANSPLSSRERWAMLNRRAFRRFPMLHLAVAPLWVTIFQYGDIHWTDVGRIIAATATVVLVIVGVVAAFEVAWGSPTGRRLRRAFVFVDATSH